MQRMLIAVGLTICGAGVNAAVAIADTPVTPTQAMAELSLPPLTSSALPVSPANSGQTLSQLFPAGDFADVSVNHWAYTAVNNLVAEYGCLAGYPDSTFRGEELVTRYEFAAALEACLDGLVQTVNQQPQVDGDDILNDLEALNRELGTLSDEINE
ncbi:MAG: S-layer homology domain-containing protein [Cyanobacteria bacterium P01_H01_bin.162]